MIKKLLMSIKHIFCKEWNKESKKVDTYSDLLIKIKKHNELIEEQHIRINELFSGIDSNLKNNIDYYLSLPYQADVKLNSDGTVFIQIKELPGCMTEGDNIEDAMCMIRDAVKSWLEVAIENNIEIPLPEVMKERNNAGK